LNASSITSGAQGYVQNAFAALQEESEVEDDDIQTVITQMAVLITQSQLRATTTAEASASVVVAIHQLHGNQQAMQQQFAAFATQCNTTYQPAPAVQPLITQFSIPNLATSIQQKGEEVDVEDMGVVDVQTWGTQEVATLEPHSQILSDMADKAACPPLVEIPDAVVVRYSLHNKPCHAMQHRCIQISSRSIQTGMYVFRVDLTSRMGIP
jgi:hypothetical protein